jgi:hypothetical protein
MLKGSWSGLKEPQSIFLSASLAKNLFGDEDPMEKQLKINSSMDVKVTGVYEDLPRNSHFNGVRFMAPWELFASFNAWMQYQGFANNFLDIYVELQPAAELDKVSENIKDAILVNIQEHKEYVQQPNCSSTRY